MSSKKILIMVLATAVFAMCLYMFGLEKTAPQLTESSVFTVGDFIDWIKNPF